MTKLEAILKYVSENNDFYKRRIKEYKITNPLDITQWPILTRKELQENRYNMFSDGYRDKFFNQQLHRQSSSGSSGIPINVYWDKTDWYASNMSMWRRRLKYNKIHPHDKYVIFTLNASGIKNKNNISLFINSPSNVLIANTSLIFERKDEPIWAKTISEFNPVWLYIQPFILNRLIETYIEYNIAVPTNLRYIESVGEILSEDIRKKAMSLFNIPVTNFYGSEEFNGIAYETISHRLEILDENVFVEVLNNDKICKNGHGEAIITSLNNHAVPLIRYNQQDIVSVFQAEDDANGNAYIQNIVGRSYNTVELNHININSFMLTEIIGEINNKLGDPIKEYKFAYCKRENILYCNIVVNSQFEKWEIAIKEHLSCLLECKIGKNNLIFKIKTVPLIYNNSKKHNIFEII